MTRPATVYDDDGRRVGRTTRQAELFLEMLTEALADGPCYVLAHPDTPPEFVARVREIVPVVISPFLPRGRMDIIEGAP